MYYQHCCPQIKLVEELCDEDVHLQNIGHVLLLHFSENIKKPLKLSVRLSDPEEVDLLTRHSRVSVGRGTKH